MLLVRMEVGVAEGCAHIFALGSDKTTRVHEDSKQRERDARRTSEGPFLKCFIAWGAMF